MNPDIMANWTLIIFMICMCILMIMGISLLIIEFVGYIHFNWKEWKNEKASSFINRQV
jgi:hypothetical protein